MPGSTRTSLRFGAHRWVYGLRDRDTEPMIGTVDRSKGGGMFERFDRPVRCKDGHLFTSIWVPMASLKALRLGASRYQRCPVGRHWTTVVPLDPATASPSELEAAAAVHDVRIP